MIRKNKREKINTGYKRNIAVVKKLKNQKRCVL